MSYKHLSRKPHNFKMDPDVWWYEESRGIELIIQKKNRTASHLIIPWETIRAALKRKDKP